MDITLPKVGNVLKYFVGTSKIRKGNSMRIKSSLLGCVLIAVLFVGCGPEKPSDSVAKEVVKETYAYWILGVERDDVEVRKIDWAEYNDALKIWEAEVTVYAFPSSLIQRRVEHVTEFTFQYDHNAKRWRGNKGKNLR